MVGGLSAAGQGVATDIIEAAGRAYVRALSTAQRRTQRGGEALPPAQPARELATP